MFVIQISFAATSMHATQVSYWFGIQITDPKAVTLRTPDQLADQGIS